MRKEAKRLGILLMITYLVSYLTRINYGAVLVEMVADTGWSKPELSAAVTGAFITYGAGQVISGFWGDRVQPRKLVLLGFLGTTTINILLPLCSNLWLMTALWCVNGFAQSFMWPPIVRLMSALLTDEEYASTTVVVSSGSSGGTIALYLISPILVTLSGWRSVFWFSALCALIIMPIWWRLCPEISQQTAPAKATVSGAMPAGQLARLMLRPMMLAILVAIICQGALRDSVTTWMPTYVSETYDIGSNIAILTGVLLPLFSILCLRITERLYARKLQNPMTCASALFVAAVGMGVLLLFLTGKNGPLSVLFLAILNGCMHGVNLLLICILPSWFRDTGRVSLISGLLNACTYLGSALSTYGVAVLTEHAGWTATIAAWLALAALGGALCLACIPAWRREHMTAKSN